MYALHTKNILTPINFILLFASFLSLNFVGKNRKINHRIAKVSNDHNKASRFESRAA